MSLMRSLRCLKRMVEITFTTQKANACFPWTACCFQLEIPFFGKFGPKTQTYQLKLKFCT